MIVNMAIVKNLEVTILSNQQPCMEYEHPSDEGRFATTAIKHVVSSTDAEVEIQLKLGPLFIFSGFDAIVYDIHLDGLLVHSGLLKERDEKAVIKDITRETNGRWKTRPLKFANVKAQDNQAQLDLPPPSHY